MSISPLTLLNEGKVKDWRKIASDTANALNTSVVHNSSDEIVNGVKTFTSTINGTADRAVKDGDGNNIASTYLKAANTPTIVVVDSEPTTVSTSTLPANSVILWTDDDEEQGGQEQGG